VLAAMAPPACQC